MQRLSAGSSGTDEAKMNREQLIKIIWSVWKRKGLTDEDLYSLIFFRFKKERMRELSDEELSQLCTIVKGFIPASARKMYMTEKQYKKIMMQMKDLGWDMDNLSSFIKKRNMVSQWDGLIESIYPAQARHIITALEKIRGRK